VQRPIDILKGEVNQAVPTENDVCLGQRIAGEIGTDEASARARICLLLAGDEFRHHIHTEILLHRVSHGACPVEIAACDVEQPACIEALQESHQLIPEVRGACQGRAWSGHGFGVSPGVLLIDLRED
jgi:hypothetical protein